MLFLNARMAQMSLLGTWHQGCNEVRWRPGQKNKFGAPVPVVEPSPQWSKFGAPMFEHELLRKQIYCIEENTCDIVWTYRQLPQ